MPKIDHARDVGLSGIAILPNRMRSLRPEVVAALAQSMKQQGLLNPITLRESEAGGYYLIAGRHRLEAARQLAWESISARVLPAKDADEALLAEIDENLIRAELSPAETAAHQAARKEVYLRLHPETRNGASGKHRPKAQLSQVATAEAAPAFIEDAAEKTGRHRATVAREVKRGADVPDVARLARTSLDKGVELDALAQLPPDKREALIERALAGEKVSAKAEVKKEQRDSREKVLAAMQMSLPQKKYGVILADPEWRFEVYSRETGMDRAADNHYPTSATDEICKRPVGDIAAGDCVLFLWATVPMLPDALRAMDSWGFAYKSHAMWRKDRVGTGYWFRNAHELLLVGTRGNIPAPAPGTQFDSVIEAPVGEHSAKPDRFYELIESYFPNLPKIELNARRARDGWDAWGLEAPNTGEILESEVASCPATSASPEPVSEPDHPQAPDAGSPLQENETTSSPETVASSEPAPEDAPSPAGAGSPSDDDLEIPMFLRRIA